MQESLQTIMLIVEFFPLLQDSIQTARVTQADANTRRKMVATLDMVIDSTQDFTDSAYTSHEHRERILNLNARARKELKVLSDVGVSIVSISHHLWNVTCTLCTIQIQHTQGNYATQDNSGI